MRVHLVIPAYRESRRLPAFLDELLPLCEEDPRDIHILVVDDGSGEEEATRLANILVGLQRKYSCLMPPLLLAENRGKGGAVYEGWKAAPSCDVVGFVDADGSIPPGEVLRLLDLYEKHPGRCLLGSRIKMLGRAISRSAKRHYLGRVYVTLLSLLLDLPVYDSQCGYKLIPYAAYQQIRDELREPGFAFDAELLMLLSRQGAELIEVPIDWHDVPGSKVHLIRDSWSMARALFRLRHRFGNPPIR